MAQARAERGGRRSRRRGGGRAGKLDEVAAGTSGRGHGGLHQLPWAEVRNPFPPLEPLSADPVEAIRFRMEPMGP